MRDRLQRYVDDTFLNKRIGILGFGREGKSSYRFLRKFLPTQPIFIADAKSNLEQLFHQEFEDDHYISFLIGDKYLDIAIHCDIVFKSPGIPLKMLEHLPACLPITSQTEVFLQLFKNQVIGVTGTKGKSTTVSLLFHILQLAGRRVLLGGNIGIPPLDLLPKLDEETIIVFELSSHQLEGIASSPHIAVFLNVFQEHLDHYKTYRDYQLAKLNIALWQQNNDFLICNNQNVAVAALLQEFEIKSRNFHLLGISDQGNGVVCENGNLMIHNEGLVTELKNLRSKVNLPGDHNMYNVAAACLAAHLSGVENNFLLEGVKSFAGLPHRLEKVGIFNEMIFINDSISTIPEATIEALKAFPETQTLILGGYDRGIDYALLCNFLVENPVEKLIFLGKAGERMHATMQKLNPEKDYTNGLVNDFNEAVAKAISDTRPGEICLLSPAASSYDEFNNFEERGNRFKQIIRDHFR